MPLEESVENFHPIDINIFDKNTDLVFNIFYKAQDASEDRFVLYASCMSSNGSVPRVDLS